MSALATTPFVGGTFTTPVTSDWLADVLSRIRGERSSIRWATFDPSYSEQFTPLAMFKPRPTEQRMSAALEEVFTNVGAASQSRQTAEVKVTVVPSTTVPMHGERERTKVRFRMLRRLGPNHDNEGAAAANHASVDAAIAFMDRMAMHPLCLATLNDDGDAVIEFRKREDDLFGDITFHSGGMVQCYSRHGTAPSKLVEGALGSREITNFLQEHLGVDYSP